MWQLSFNQKVWLGFGIVVSLLSISGLNSLWNLNSISDSNRAVSETAVPVVRVANEVQIRLLKLANTSALGFNTFTEDEIYPYRRDFDAGAKDFAEAFNRLETLTERNEEMHGLVQDIKANYTAYSAAVNEMFDAKLETLVAKRKADEAVDDVVYAMDDLGQTYADIMNFSPPPEKSKLHFEASGFCNQADMYLQGAVKTVLEVKRASAIEDIETAAMDALDAMNNATISFDLGADRFSSMDKDGYIDSSRRFRQVAEDKINQSPNFVDMKRKHLELVQISWDKLKVSKDTVNKAVEGLDNLLAQTDTEFSNLQQDLSDSVQLGINTTLILMVILLSLTTVNFQSMRSAIRKKMADLAQLNQIGGALAASRDQDSALNQVLHAMSEKIGIQYGSVYLFNKDQELEARAFLPPMSNPDRKPVTFNMGQGILGRAAESRKTIFVPDTTRDGNYVASEGEKPKALLCVPLVDGEVLVGVMNLSGEVNKVAFADSDYEFVSTVAHSLVTTIKNIRMVEVIEEHNRDLEKKVAERTKELKQKNDDVANMLSNMKQGLFTIIDGGVIHPEYARFLESIFETPHISHRNFSDLLFTSCSLSTDAIDSAVTAVMSIVGEDSMMYEFNSHLLATEFALQFPGQPDKLLELEWNPIMDENDTVIKLMVTVRDVTALKALQAEAEKQKQELNIIGEILAVDAGKFGEFIAGSRKFIAACREIIRGNAHKDLNAIGDLFRNIHTVKGNSRTYGFKLITEVVHEVENTYDQLRKNEELAWDPAQLLVELQAADDVVDRYHAVASVKLGRDGSSTSSRLDPAVVSGFLRKVTSLMGDAVPDSVMPIVNEARRLQATLEGKPIAVVIDDVTRSVKSLASELGKESPDIRIDDGGVYIRDEHHGLLNNIFMHLMRNSMDHGIEKADDRIAAGKPPQGTIAVDAEALGSRLRIVLRDDGRGIAIGRIYQKAIEQGRYDRDEPRPSATEIANLIFASGFSTAEQVTEVSGRGVGMDAVRNFLQSAGGSIDVVVEHGDESADFRRFHIEIVLPESFFFAPMPLAKAG